LYRDLDTTLRQWVLRASSSLLLSSYNRDKMKLSAVDTPIQTTTRAQNRMVKGIILKEIRPSQRHKLSRDRPQTQRSLTILCVYDKRFSYFIDCTTEAEHGAHTAS
jgi:hypothetical protein